ncbi:MAG: M48 family metallopeptidase [Candidatus Fermentibacteraceae bacterium]
MTILLISLLAWGIDIPSDITDIIESDEVTSAVAVVEAFQDANRELTDTEEYYLGRSVAAYMLTNYTPDWHAGRTGYLNLLGTALAGYSPRPFTYGGYHFLLLDSPEVNAMACPGGLIFITEGLSDLAGNEDQMAAILAHEIAHVVLAHGVGAVSRAKMTAAWTTLGTEGARHLGGDDVREMAENYGDIVSEITGTIVTTGYSRDSERAADSLAVHILADAGYSPSALALVLDRMALQGGTQGFWKTHPSPSDRAAWVRSIIQTGNLPEPPAEAIALRARRFADDFTNAQDSPEQTTPPPSRGSSSQGSRGEGGR